MSVCGRKALTLLSSVFAVCSLGLLGIAVSTDYWLYLEEGIILPQNQSIEIKMSLHSGLWRVCFLTGEERARCFTIEYVMPMNIQMMSESTVSVLKMIRSATPFPLVSLAQKSAGTLNSELILSGELHQVHSAQKSAGTLNSELILSGELHLLHSAERSTGTLNSELILSGELHQVHSAERSTGALNSELILSGELHQLHSAQKSAGTLNSELILSGLSLVVGLVLYISSINDEVLNRTKDNEAYFSYKYGWSFAFAAISFLLTESAGVMSVYLFMKRYTAEEICRPQPGFYRPRLSNCSDYSGQFLHPDSWVRDRSPSDISSDTSLQMNSSNYPALLKCPEYDHMSSSPC
ncbi:UNVERIFIED_CONTAM: hypothetical protein FKN15_044779 [Acipenser sinensis]